MGDPFRPVSGYPERFAQQALGHISKAVHHAYSKQAEVTVLSLVDWEKRWRKVEASDQKAVIGDLLQPAVVVVDFKAGPVAAEDDGGMERRGGNVQP